MGAVPIGELSPLASGAVAVVVSVLSSTVIAAVVAGRMSRSTERKQQLRAEMLDAAGNFAGSAMEALASLRYYKPTKPRAEGLKHQNERLFDDRDLRAERFQAASATLDSLRHRRGRVHLVFSASSAEDAVIHHAGEVIGHQRQMLDVSTEFWELCDADPAGRPQHEAKAGKSYASSREAAWAAVYRFCDVAGERMQSP